MGCIYLELEIEQTSHEERMFDFIYLVYKDGWRLEGDIIIIYTNPNFKQ